MRKVCAAIAALALIGCATSGVTEPKDKEAPATYSCTRLEAAMLFLGKAFDPMAIENKAVEDCKHSSPAACLAVPVAMPVEIVVGAFCAPLLFPMAMVDDHFQALYCPGQP